MNIVILGSGYVGLTTGVTLSYVGHRVTCVDTDEVKIAQLREGNLPIHEPHLAELARLLDGRLQYASDAGDVIPDADVIFIAVGTPPLPDGSPELSYLRAAAASIGRNLKSDFTVVVNKSTVPIGCGNWVESLIAEASEGRRRAHQHFSVASNPEFLREGSAVHDSLYPERVVLGADDASVLEHLYSLYKPVLEQTFPAPSFLPRPEGLGAVPLITTNLASSELIKYAANSFLALKISFINEIGQLAERIGGDIQKVAQGIGLDSRIGRHFLQAGIGWGGSCFGKDTAALISSAAEYGLEMPIVSAAREVNYRQREYVLKKLLDELKILKGKTIGLLGVAFKPHTDDLRDSPALEIARHLLGRGAWVRAHDPVALNRARREKPVPGVCFVDAVEDLARDADALILVTEWPQYRDLPWEELVGCMRGHVVLDGRNVLDRERLEALGFRYVGIGTCASPASNTSMAPISTNRHTETEITST